MDKYLITAPTTLPAGARVGLSKDQAAAREHALDKVGKHYVAKLPLNFKAGEEIAYDGELPKTLAHSMSRTKEKDVEPAGPKDVAQPLGNLAAD